MTYYLKRPRLLLRVGAGLVSGSANRQIARSLRCAHTTVALQQARIARHAMLLLARAVRHLRGTLREPCVLDHLETFEYSQDYPFGVATAVASPSWFVLSLDPAIHRRSGRISSFQRRRLEARPARRPHDGYARSTHRTFDTLLPPPPAAEPLIVRTDGHAAYERARRRHAQADRIRLESYPNPRRGEKGSPRSAEARLRDARLFPVDLLHKIMRHSLSHQRRGKIAITRRLKAAAGGVTVLANWRDFPQGGSERGSGSGTPAAAAWLAGRRRRGWGGG